MSKQKMLTVDGNEAVALVAYRLSEVALIYPITPSSTMGELSDEWSSYKRKNIWGTVPMVVEMQSEGGAAGAMHGSTQAGALSVTFTASQGLLLMIPNMYKMAGELSSFAMHVSARSLAVQGLCIFGDHSDVMSTRQTGFAMLASGSPQEAHDMAAVAHMTTLTSRVPFLHFFDGFRTSHEVSKISVLSDEDLHALIDEQAISAHRARALTPDNPVIRGTAQNPDTYFQGRERSNPFYAAAPQKVLEAMAKLEKVCGRSYKLFDYYGAPDAERVMIMMGSGAEAAHETVNHLAAKGEKVGLIKVRLYRPFSTEHLIAALPNTVKAIAVMDRTKEPGSIGEPLYMDVVTGLAEAGKLPKTIIGGRYGLGSKDFTPGMVKAIFDELNKSAPKKHFTIGIIDDVSDTSLTYDAGFDIEPDEVVRAVFFGLGADGTVGANKNSIKIIGEDTPNYAQGYFVYDSKKSGGVTISHLRFGPKPIQSTYQIAQASFVACHQHVFMDKMDVLHYAKKGATFLLNSPHDADHVWDSLPCPVQESLIAKEINFYVIDADKVAKQTGMGRRINTVMQTCFFAISGVLPKDEAIEAIKHSIEKTYGKKGPEVVQKNFKAVDETVANLFKVKIHPVATSTCGLLKPVPDDAPDFVKNVTGMMIEGKGDFLPVSAFSEDGTWPTGTTKWEKRNIATEVPYWDPNTCIQCAKCSFTCPHAAIRVKLYDAALLKDAPASFKSVKSKAKDDADKVWTVQVAAEDCTGCGVCVHTCPAKNKENPELRAINMMSHDEAVKTEIANYKFFLDLPYPDPTTLKDDIKGTQLREPLFEYSGACAGCGETPYIKLLSQMFGDRLLIANATGCTSIYGGNLPTTPYCKNADGRGPAWANSLFEDNAEFGLGFRLAIEKHSEQARELVTGLAGKLGDDFVGGLLNADQTTDAGINTQRDRVRALKAKLDGVGGEDARRLKELSDYLVKKSVWIIGGDGWAYDIGYGGLDHVLATGHDVNVLVLDTEVYSNTGGQASKSTPIGASAKFATAGKAMPKKDLGLISMTYGNIYVAQTSLGYRELHTIKAFREADSYQGSSIVIAYSHCINHGFDLVTGNDQQKLAVESGHWPLFRFDPRRREESLNPFVLDSGEPKVKLSDYAYNENRYRMLKQMDAVRAAKLMEMAEKETRNHYNLYRQLADLKCDKS